MKTSQIVHATGEVVSECENRARAERPAASLRSRPAAGALDRETRQLVECFLEEFVGLAHLRSESEALSTMKRVVGDILTTHTCAYEGMIEELSLDDSGDDVRFVGKVANCLFEDGVASWGRVAGFLAFGAAVCRRLNETGRGTLVKPVGCEISTYLLTHQTEWLVDNNSWNGFVEFFRVAEPEATSTGALETCAKCVGIGATLTLLIGICLTFRRVFVT
ncbi:induced myeloid leukemia cell differentiation protein Mcl-1 homolog [Pseudoliparis swirei]|uniref:induced myeloid leukemia cell differentiation protein Mcl-1 homolog n=1 Tax=Pseudoliparis swirei TaxID=2059687 RepID=UPI0024BEFEFC|nr:induced myeloid leukemia cell differentiation protein Mcl-1 homolog [Pseudoliparis swirei]